MPSVEKLKLPLSDSFWPNVAAHVAEFADGGTRVVVVPQRLHVAALRAALAGHIAARGLAAIAVPRITTLADWIAVEADVAGPGRSDAVRRIALFEALANTGLAERLLGASAAARWALARQLLALCDSLTLAASGWLSVANGAAHERLSAAAPSRLSAMLRAAYRGRAWIAASPEAELVLGLWPVVRDDRDRLDAPTRMLGTLARLADDPPGAIVIVSDTAPVPAWTQDFIERAARRTPVLGIGVDVANTLGDAPVWLAAWPELGANQASRDASHEFDGSHDAPHADLLTRARALGASASPLVHVELIATTGLEDEAVCAAESVLAAIDAGHTRIALVALDRVVARRVRALLERAAVVVVDELGWKLSTTSAAGALMRWLELADPATPEVETDVLLDWLKSPFTWNDVPDRQALIAAIERAVRSNNLARGWSALLDALAAANDATSQTARVRLAALRRTLNVPAGARLPGEHFEWLAAALAANGMHAALAHDAVGSDVLGLLARLSVEAETTNASQAERSAGPRLSFDAWRAFVGDALENTVYREQGTDSPVRFVSLAGAALRVFDAVIVVGADARHFPAQGEERPLFAPALAAELGLADRDADQRHQLAGLAMLLATAQRASVSWQKRVEGEANALAAPLERLRMVERLAHKQKLQVEHVWSFHTVTAQPGTMPRPVATARVPERLSPSLYNTLRTCPYRYFARGMLGLVAQDEVSEDRGKRDYGEVVHRILQNFHETPDVEETADAAALEALLRSASDAVFEPLLASNGEYIGWRERWLAIAPSYVAWLIAWRDAGWRFESAETPRRHALALADGRALMLTGRVDRIDRQTRGSSHERAIAILDYKARPKKDLQDALAAPIEDVQLPFYRLLARDALHADARYLSVDKDQVEEVCFTADLDALADALETRIVDEFSRLASGAALPAHGAQSTCVHCDARGLCRKGSWSE